MRGGVVQPLAWPCLGSPTDQESGRALPVSWVTVARACQRVVSGLFSDHPGIYGPGLSHCCMILVSGLLNQLAGPGFLSGLCPGQPESARAGQPVPCHTSGSLSPLLESEWALSWVACVSQQQVGISSEVSARFSSQMFKSAWALSRVAGISPWRFLGPSLS